MHLQNSGAARPAYEVYPEYYPEYHQAKRKKEADREAARENYLEKYKGEYSLHQETRKLLGLKLQYAFEVLSGATGNGRAAKAFNKVLDCDNVDNFGARFGLVFANIDCGDLAGARKEIEFIKKNVDEKDVPAEIYWALVIIEYISFAVLQEEGSDGDAADSALKIALKHNSYIPAIFKNHKKLEKVLDPDETELIVRQQRDAKLNAIYNKESTPNDKFVGTLTAGSVPSGSFDEAVIFFLNQISCWKDAKGSLEWLESTSNLFLKSSSSSKPSSSDSNGILRSVQLDKNSPLHFVAKKVLKAILQ